ncbi:MAG: CocE/NonD family hydrolase [Steroidobacteraceae bacterium]
MSESFKRIFRKAIHPQLGHHPGFGYRTEQQDGVLIERDVTVTLRTGLKVQSDVFRLPDRDDLPAIICYAPFGKHPHIDLKTAFAGSDIPFDRLSPHTPFEVFDPIRWAREGFALCIVDAVGNWYSEGKACFFSRAEAESGHDIVEWFAARPWCNGKVGWGAVSYYAMTAWSVAALRPPHLAAILPWDGASDIYRECLFSGGIPIASLTHNWMLLTGYGLDEVEDTEAATFEHPLYDEFWRSRVADWSRIQVPTYAVTEWSNNLHLRGTLEAWKQLGSERKYLDINGGKEWAEFYSEWGFERQRAFLGEFLKGESNGVSRWSPVRIALREDGQTWRFREERAWPLQRAQHVALYLDATDHSLRPAQPAAAAETRYLSTDESQRAVFDHRFGSRTEITGHSKLRLWIAVDGTNDADLFVAIQKLDRSGQVVPFVYSQMFNDGPAAFGWLRASHRELDLERSRPEQPWHRHERRLWLTHLQPVAVDIEIWPTNILFEAGETLRLVIQGSDIHKAPGSRFELRHWPLHNYGNHIIHTGGSFDSHLLIPVIPA